MTDELTFQCRRSKTCRAMLPASKLERGPTNELVCQAGQCPNKHQPSVSGDTALALQMEARRWKRKATDAKAGEERALAKLERLSDQLTVALDIRDIDAPGQIKAGAGHPDGEACPIMMISDIHCGQVVKPQIVNGLNAFDPDIFDERLDNVFRNSLKVIRSVRTSCPVKQGILWLGGDMIEGELHPDAIQNQTLTTTQQLIRCEYALVRGIEHWLRHSDLERIIVPCNVGNHDRNTLKVRSNTTENSYALLMYHNLRRHFKDEPRVEFHISDANCLYLDVYGKRLRFMHGDMVRYNGGIAGPIFNVVRYCREQDQSVFADHTFHGHFHQLYFGSKTTGNGSLPGVAPYGLNSGYTSEAPQQGMRFIHSTRGMAGAFPIYAD